MIYQYVILQCILIYPIVYYNVIEQMMKYNSIQYNMTRPCARTGGNIQSPASRRGQDKRFVV